MLSAINCWVAVASMAIDARDRPSTAADRVPNSGTSGASPTLGATTSTAAERRA
jgi:hypothetical protein